MTIEIAPISSEQVNDFTRAVWLGFHDFPASDADVERAGLRWVDGRSWAAFDDNAMVATVRTDIQQTTLPGGRALPTSGLTAVTTRSTHRRQGLLREMIVRALRADLEAGDQLATLVASEYPIYGRFGYGPAIENAGYSLRAGTTWTFEGSGRVELADNETMLAVAPTVYEQHRLAHAGEIDRDELDWANRIGGRPSEPWKGFQAICRDSTGVATGYVRYKIDSQWDGRQPNASLEVVELIAVDVASEARLWRYVCEVDWVRTVKAADRGVEERVPWWLVDARDFRQTERADFIWARPLNVPACLAARGYAAPIDVVIDVVDPLELAGGRFRLVAEGAEASCTATRRRSADLVMPIATLGSILFGGHSLSLLAAVGRVDESKPGAVARTDLAFRTPAAPWTATWF